MAEPKGKAPEREFEVGKDEAWFSNIKRTYDEYQHRGLQAIDIIQGHTAEVLASSRNHMNRMFVLSETAIANCITAQHELSNQHLAHRDIATDCTWDPGPGEESLKKK